MKTATPRGINARLKSGLLLVLVQGTWWENFIQVEHQFLQ